MSILNFRHLGSRETITRWAPPGSTARWLDRILPPGLQTHKLCLQVCPEVSVSSNRTGRSVSADLEWGWEFLLPRTRIILVCDCMSLWGEFDWKTVVSIFCGIVGSFTWRHGLSFNDGLESKKLAQVWKPGMGVWFLLGWLPLAFYLKLLDSIDHIINSSAVHFSPTLLDAATDLWGSVTQVLHSLVNEN